jgi:hypothetical protein
MDAFYLGHRPKGKLTQILEKAGHRIVHASYKKGILSSVPTCSAIVLHWKSIRDQRIIEEAKSVEIPVLVITAHLAAALLAGEPQADLYVEDPASDDEVAMLLIDLMTAKQKPATETEPSAKAKSAAEAAAQKACGSIH